MRTNQIVTNDSDEPLNRAGFVGDRRVWRYAARADSARFRL